MAINPGRTFKEHYDTNLFVSLGSGGFGQVYRTSHKASGVARAVKVVRREALHPEIDSICAELESLLELDHPHVLRLYDYFEDQAAVYLVTEIADGGDLHEVIQEVGQPGQREEAARLFRHLMLAVAYCHARGVCHRDLKVENCLLSSREERLLKVIDFGLAAVKAPADEDGHWMKTTLGTPFYMSPEVIDKKATYGTKCDIWSAGVILYLLLTGEHPFKAQQNSVAGGGTNILRLFERVRKMEPASGPLDEWEVPQQPRKLVLSLLTKDPDKRPSAPEVLRHPWLDVSTPVSLNQATDAGNGSSTRRLCRRFRSVVGLSRLERAILTLAAAQASNDDLTELRRAFEALDRNGDGLLSKGEIEQAFLASGMSLEKSDLEAVFDAFDSKGLGKIQYTAWLAATLHPDVLASDQAVQMAFAYFARAAGAAGAESSGAISKADLLMVLDEEDAQAVLENWAGDAGAASGALQEEDFRRLVADLAARRRVLEMSPKGSTPITCRSPYTPGSNIATPRLFLRSTLAAGGSSTSLVAAGDSPE